MATTQKRKKNTLKTAAAHEIFRRKRRRIAVVAAGAGAGAFSGWNRRCKNTNHWCTQCGIRVSAPRFVAWHGVLPI